MSEVQQSRLELTQELCEFMASGLNDDRRVDLTRGRVFLAVDDPHTINVDDAFRVNCSKSGYDVEIAAADASQLLGHPAIIGKIVDHDSALYRRGKTAMVLPRPIINALGLQAGKQQRALVIRQSFDRAGGLIGGPVLIPALIRAGRTTPEGLGKMVLKNPRHLLLRGAYLINGGRANESSNPDDLIRFRRLGTHLVSTYTTFANTLAAEWASKEHVPVLCLKHSQNGGMEPYYVNIDTVPGAKHPAYAQITSALRRGIDAMNHMNLGHHLAHRAPVFDADTLGQVALRFNARRQPVSSEAS